MSRYAVSGGSAPQLHELLRAEHEAILKEWSQCDRQSISSARDLSDVDQRNNVPQILETIARHCERAAEDGRQIGALPEEVAKEHATQRWGLGFSLEEMAREYGLLRSVILGKITPWAGELPAEELVFLNETLDKGIIAGISTYAAISNKALIAERECLLVTLESIADGVVSTDPGGRLIYLNPAAERMSGWSQEEAKGQPVSEVFVTVHEASQQCLPSLAQIVAACGESARHAGEVLLRQRGGNLLQAEVVAAPLWDGAGSFLGVVTTFRDVSKVRALTRQVGYLAGHDPVTGLPNRSLFIERLSQELAHAERHGDALALLYLNLDLFKDVNDMLGHAAGDELLKLVAQRLQDCVRRSDTVCSLGGDEFVVLVTDFGSLGSLSELAAKITRTLSAPYAIRAETVDISTSVGVSVYPGDGANAETLIKHANTAMYQAKSRGRNTLQFFAPEMNKSATERRALQSDLRKALAADQLSLHFQPQVALCSGEIIGAEALLRWNHPRLGLISPGRFIPVAEGNRDTMISIGNWVLEQACRQARAWIDGGYGPLRISVNLSIVQLHYDSLLDHVADLLQRFQLPAELLQLELTESVLMSDVSGATERVRKLETMGVRIAVDDFGTGYSSLSYLKDLPVDELKIDQSFIHELGSDPNKAGIVQAVIRMAQSLNLRVIAEGVEDQAAVDFLTMNGCEGAQGHFYSEAITPVAFEERFLMAGIPILS